MKPTEITKRVDLAKRTAVQAGALLLRELHRLKASDVRSKSRNNFVTHVDLASEKILLSAIKRAFPKDAVLSEEAGALAGSDVSWIIDPLDGTSNFIHKIPFFGVSIGIAADGRMQGGVLYVPSRKELFWGQEKKGAFLNGKRIRVSTRSTLSSSLVGTAIPYKALHKRWNEYQPILRAIALQGGDTRRSGAMAVDLAYVACGRLDGLWAFDQAPWDLAAGELLVREAGGLTTELRAGKHPDDRLAGNPALHGVLTKLIAGL